MSDEIKVGGVVVLKSGGPKMTVSGTDGKGWFCTWIAFSEPKGRWILGQARFAAACLVLARDGAANAH